MEKPLWKGEKWEDLFVTKSGGIEEGKLDKNSKWSKRILVGWSLPISYQLKRQGDQRTQERDWELDANSAIGKREDFAKKFFLIIGSFDWVFKN